MKNTLVLEVRKNDVFCSEMRGKNEALTTCIYTMETTAIFLLRFFTKESGFRAIFLINEIDVL